MAKKFSAAEWGKILRLLKRRGADFGLPGKRKKSVVIGSFNIRKLGNVKSKSKSSWEFLRYVCRRFDLLAVQEVADTLDGIKHLKGLLKSSYGVVVSDTTGKHPGSRSLAERLAFLFRWKRVTRTEVASDITYDRTIVSNTLFDKRDDFWKAFKAHAKEVKKGKKPVPAVPNPHFLTFIRQPLCVSFEVRRPDQKPYQFLTVNCHLLYGDDKEERRREFYALIGWLTGRAKSKDRMYYKNLLLLGDCNLDFQDPVVDRKPIDDYLKKINKTVLKSKSAAKLNFPFLTIHPDRTDLFKTAARLKSTYDQAALFFRDKRLPDYKKNKTAGKKVDGYDYGVFNFTDLIATAIHKKKYEELTESQKGVLIKKFEHDLSDHLPIWIRLPLT